MKEKAEKRVVFKQQQKTRSEEDHEEYGIVKKEANKAVVLAKEKEYEKLYSDLKSNRPKKIYKLAKTRMGRKLKTLIA